MPTPTSRILRPAQPAKSANGSIIGSRPYRSRSCATKKSTEPHSPDTSVDPQGRASQYARTWSLTEFMAFPLGALKIPRHALVSSALDNHAFQHFHKASGDLVPSCLLTRPNESSNVDSMTASALMCALSSSRPCTGPMFITRFFNFLRLIFERPESPWMLLGSNGNHASRLAARILR